MFCVCVTCFLNSKIVFLLTLFTQNIFLRYFESRIVLYSMHINFFHLCYYICNQKRFSTLHNIATYTHTREHQTPEFLSEIIFVCFCFFWLVFFFFFFLVFFHLCFPFPFYVIFRSISKNGIGCNSYSHLSALKRLSMRLA